MLPGVVRPFGLSKKSVPKNDHVSSCLIMFHQSSFLDSVPTPNAHNPCCGKLSEVNPGINTFTNQIQAGLEKQIGIPHPPVFWYGGGTFSIDDLLAAIARVTEGQLSSMPAQREGTYLFHVFFSVNI